MEGDEGSQGKNAKQCEDCAKNVGKLRCSRCLAEVPVDVKSCPKCGAPLLLPVRDGPLRDAVKFSFVAPLFSKPRFVYDSEGLLVRVETEFRLYKALKEVKQPPVILYDADGYVNVRRHEYSLVRLDADTVARIAEAVPEKIWSQLLGSHNLNVKNGEEKHPAVLLWEAGVIVSPVPRLRNVEFLRTMDWRNFVEEIVRFKGVELDPRLRLTRLAHLLRGLKQAINPHALIVLPGQTGKSEWYKYVGQCEDKVSANSLIGYADAEGPRLGSVDGSELPFALDQIESSGMYTIFRYMLGLMEFGEARVDMAAYPFDIHSSSVFAILSNPVGEVKSNFAVLLEKLSKNPALGRRFGIILYDKDAARIKRREKDMDVLRGKIALFRAVEEYCLPRLKKILDEEKVWSWLNTRNEEFVKQALQLIEPLENEDENLYLFLKEFIENGWSHIRGGALRAAMTLNLDKIALDEYTVEELLTEAEEILSDLLKVNFESLRLIAATFQETQEQGDLRAFDMLPTYMKEIVSAVEQWRRSLTEEERASLKIPLSFYLNTLHYNPKSADYFSQVLLIARRGNPEKYNEMLKAHFQFEIKKESNGLVAVIYSVEPISHLKTLLDNLDILENLADSEEGASEKAQGIVQYVAEQLNNTVAYEPVEKNTPSNIAKLSKLSKMSKAPHCLASVVRLSCQVVDTCSICGFNGCMAWQANLKSGSWTLLCEHCGSIIQKVLEGC